MEDPGAQGHVARSLLSAQPPASRLHRPCSTLHADDCRPVLCAACALQGIATFETGSTLSPSWTSRTGTPGTARTSARTGISRWAAPGASSTQGAPGPASTGRTTGSQVSSLPSHSCAYCLRAPAPHFDRGAVLCALHLLCALQRPSTPRRTAVAWRTWRPYPWSRRTRGRRRRRRRRRTRRTTSSPHRPSPRRSPSWTIRRCCSSPTPAKAATASS